MKHELRIIIVLLVLDLLGSGGLWFGYSTLVAKEGERAQLRKELDVEKQKAAESRALQKTLTQAEKEHGALTGYFYGQGEENQIKFVSQIEGLGRGTSGAVVETKSFDVTAGGSPRFHSELAVSGAWKEVYHFLRLIEVFPARVIITRFSASVTDRNTAKEEWNGAMSIDVTSLKSM